MADIASVLKSEITRLARKEVRAQQEPMKKALAASKAQIAELRAEVRALTAALKQIGKPPKSPVTAKSEGEQANTRQRFTAKGFASLRARLDLSCVEMGTLIGASDQSVRKWEEGAAVPRQKFQQAIFALRTLKKREVAEKLRAGSAA